MTPSTGIVLSILTPAVPSRLKQLGELCEKVQKAIGNLPVEHLIFLDNKKRTVGEKRDSLLRIARGQYVAFVDDDDDISPDYCREIVTAAATNPDVITFLQHSTVNGQEGIIEFGLGNPNEAFIPGGTAKRAPWHICAWQTSVAILSSFPPINYGEDWAFASRLVGLPGLTSAHIPKILHYYRHSSATTEAPPPG